jgi:hypothetical protein
MNVTKKPNDPVTFYWFAALFYFMNKMPSDQKPNDPMTLIFLFEMGSPLM